MCLPVNTKRGVLINFKLTRNESILYLIADDANHNRWYSV